MRHGPVQACPHYFPRTPPVRTMRIACSTDRSVSTTRLRGATYLRAGILNSQSTEDDVDDLLELLRRLARHA